MNYGFMDETDSRVQESEDIAFEINKLIVGKNSTACLLAMSITIMYIAEGSDSEELEWIYSALYHSSRIIKERYNKMKKLQ